VHGMPDDRTFVVQAVVNAKPGESPTYAWYLLRIAPGSAHPHQLTKLPIELARQRTVRHRLCTVTRRPGTGG